MRYNKHLSVAGYQGAFVEEDARTMEQILGSFLARQSHSKIESETDLHVMLGTQTPGETPPLAAGQVRMTIHFPPGRTNDERRDRYAQAMKTAFLARNPSQKDALPAIIGTAPYALDLVFASEAQTAQFFNSMSRVPLLGTGASFQR